jgi:hypothetical protein
VITPRLYEPISKKAEWNAAFLYVTLVLNIALAFSVIESGTITVLSTEINLSTSKAFGILLGATSALAALYQTILFKRYEAEERVALAAQLYGAADQATIADESKTSPVRKITPNAKVARILRNRAQAGLRFWNEVYRFGLWIIPATLAVLVLIFRIV